VLNIGDFAWSNIQINNIVVSINEQMLENMTNEEMINFIENEAVINTVHFLSNNQVK
jgi:hypothetical protein